MEEFENDPDWLRAKDEAERKDPNYWTKRNIEEIEIHLRSLPMFTFLGCVIAVFLALILWRIW